MSGRAVRSPYKFATYVHYLRAVIVYRWKAYWRVPRRLDGCVDVILPEYGHWIGETWTRMDCFGGVGKNRYRLFEGRRIMRGGIWLGGLRRPVDSRRIDVFEGTGRIFYLAR